MTAVGIPPIRIPISCSFSLAHSGSEGGCFFLVVGRQCEASCASISQIFTSINGVPGKVLVPGKCSEQENKIPVPGGYPWSYKFTHKLKKVRVRGFKRSPVLQSDWLVGEQHVFRVIWAGTAEEVTVT